MNPDTLTLYLPFYSVISINFPSVGSTCPLSNAPCWRHICAYVQCCSVPRSVFTCSLKSSYCQQGARITGGVALHGPRDSAQSVTDDDISSSYHGVWKCSCPRHLVSPWSLNKSGQRSSIKITFPPLSSTHRVSVRHSHGPC